jgi:hypothetical protein
VDVEFLVWERKIGKASWFLPPKTSSSSVFANILPLSIWLELSGNNGYLPFPAPQKLQGSLSCGLSPLSSLKPCSDCSFKSVFFFAYRKYWG